MEKYKGGNSKAQAIINILPFIFMLSIFILFLILPTTTFSISEQRYLTQLPSPSTTEVINGSYMTKFENFFSDQFPFRDFWICIRKNGWLDSKRLWTE